MSSKKYVPPHMRNRMLPTHNAALQQTKERVAFLGDSFIRLFGLLNKNSATEVIKLRAFKGASAKGLGRKGNENGDTIRQMLSRSRFDRVVFCFGSVDVHLSYYFKKYVKEEADDFDSDTIARLYVEFVASLQQPGCLIVGVYGSALEEKDVTQSLRCYGSLGHNYDEEPVAVDPDDISLSARQHRVFDFNASLANYCEEHKNIQYIDANGEMLDQETLKMKDAYRDVSDCNIHVVWETTLMLWLKKLPWLKKLAPKDLEDHLQASFDEYLKTKPWAERSKHVKPLHELIGMEKLGP